MTQAAKQTYRLYDEKGNDVTDEIEAAVEQETHLTVINPLNPGSLLPSKTNLPLHYQALHLDQLSDEEAENALDMLHTYTQVIPTDLKEYANTTITILGAILQQHQEFNSKVTGKVEQGYYNVLLKLSEVTEDKQTKEKRNVIVKSSGKLVAEAMVSLMALRGFGDWKTPYKALVKIAADNRQFLQRAK